MAQREQRQKLGREFDELYGDLYQRSQSGESPKGVAEYQSPVASSELARGIKRHTKRNHKRHTKFNHKRHTKRHHKRHHKRHTKHHHKTHRK